MKLWILKPVDARATIAFPHLPDHQVLRWTWECSYGFVIRAATEQRARAIASELCGNEGEDAWINPEISTCEPLTDEGEEEVVLRDFLGS